MNTKGRHGKDLTSYEEAVMDLMISIEKSERYLQRRNQDAVIVIEKGEEEAYPSFSIGKKTVEDGKEQRTAEVENRESFMMITNIRKDRCTAKLTAWEWLEVRRAGICTGILMFTVFFLQIYTAWKEMDIVSRQILQGMKYSCLIVLTWKLVHWIISGKMIAYLNEES